MTFGRSSCFLNGCFLEDFFLDSCFDLKSLQNPLMRNWMLRQPLLLVTCCLSIQIFDSPPFCQHSQLGHLWLPTPHFAGPMLLTGCHSTPEFPPILYHECYGFERVFFTLRRFLTCTPSCCFQDLSRAGSSTLNVAGLHADLRNIAPARQLF